MSATSALTVQLLEWTAERPRTYGEAMEAWRTACPRMPIWEDAISAGLIEARAAPGARMNERTVRLTPLGLAALAKGR